MGLLVGPPLPPRTGFLSQHCWTPGWSCRHVPQPPEGLDLHVLCPTQVV